MRGGRGEPAFGIAGGRMDSASATAQVKAAVAAATSGKRATGVKKFTFDRVTPREAAVAPLLGIYLGFSVARVHERFPNLEVPNLLMGLMAIMLVTVGVAVPRDGWRTTWKTSRQLRLVALLAGLSIFTAPIGIWMSGSLDYFMTRYSIAIGVYIACLLLCRDKKVLRRVVALYVAIATAVAVVNVAAYFSGDMTGTYMNRHDLALYQDPAC